ncbi:DNA polymerase I [Rhodobacteraceae bacterium THAF1]|uniref:DNA polymerase I n=1 Tax=Palleronia sp. THAF1 TaxID=2587842 RepID=UPI000F3E6F85|nr:DNA polymerase I [Palleronia sp. THAF1]QFU07488.1 DNA polymerase I [Palleronia sp. THAF1]VDC20434.1 DNA polymerase I [Rhodobacteraceae bacterium THAF1]
MSFGKGHHLHLVDGSAFIFRAFHALPPLTRKSDGTPVGAVSGFVNMLWKMIQDNKGPDAPTHAAVVFDKGSHTFRNDMYDQYKANRDEMPEDLRPQIPLTRDATRAFNLACLEQEGFEADDIIATLACKAREAGGRCTIISSDKDLMQLIGDGVVMFDAMKNTTIDREGVEAKFGVGPERVVDVQALAGDSVDNVPGAPGIGIKTAALLINEFGTLEELLDRAEEVPQPKRRQTLIEHREQIELSKKLVQLDCDMTLDYDLASLEVKEPDPDTLLQFLGDMEFRTIVRRVSEELGVDTPAIPAASITAADEEIEEPPFPEDYTWVKTEAELADWVERATAQGFVAIDTETTSLNEMQALLVGVSLALGPGVACYIPLAHKENAEADLFSTDALADGQIDFDTALKHLKPLLEDSAVLKILQNAKYDYKILSRLGIHITPIDDTMLISYAQHAGLHNHGMDALSERYLGHTCIPIKELIGTGKSQITFDKVPVDKAVRYAAEDADVTLRLHRTLKPSLHRARVTTVYETLERPLIPVLARMEMAGVQVDRNTLSRMSGAFAQKMAGLEAEIAEIAGAEFNVGSPKQLGEILFDKMGLPGGKKGKTGAYSTGADILEELATEHELPRKVLDWRQVSKLKSTYTDALQDHIDPETGRVHTSYSIAGASTGRLASTDPNLQNIPIRTEEGRRIREAFVAPEGKVLVSLDYSQIELRILAHIAGIDALKQAFKDGQDIHATTASEMFGVPLDQMTADVRRQAKAINFGVIYGISGFGLARNLRIPREEAQGFIDRYFERFPGIKDYMAETTAFAKEHGYVETLFGRRINTPEINARGPGAGFAKRAAINAPIQGTAADVIRRAMIRMEDAIADLPATMLLQVHDELLFEVDEGHQDALIATAREVMEGAANPTVHLTVPLDADAGQGASWADAH